MAGKALPARNKGVRGWQARHDRWIAKGESEETAREFANYWSSGKIQAAREKATPIATEIDRLTADLATLSRVYEEARNANDTMRSAWEAARVEAERLREALRWYASDDAWTMEQVEGSNGDYGNRARAALRMNIEEKADVRN